MPTLWKVHSFVYAVAFASSADVIYTRDIAWSFEAGRFWAEAALVVLLLLPVGPVPSAPEDL